MTGSISDSMNNDIGLNFNEFSGPIEKVQTRIVNGNAVYPPFKYDNIVSLQYNHEHSCGGTLLTDNCVVTAAHCSKVPGTESFWTAKLHRHNLNKTNKEENGQTYQVKKFENYPYYNADKKLHDISIWKLDVKKPSGVYRTDFDWSSTVDKSFSMVKVAGWGVTKYKGEISQVLQEIDIPIYPKDECEKNIRAHNRPFDAETQFCGGDLEGGKDSCTGDSGGPLFTIDKNGRMLLEGIVNWGIDCGVKGQPGIYAKIDYYLDWILATCYGD